MVLTGLNYLRNKEEVPGLKWFEVFPSDKKQSTGRRSTLNVAQTIFPRDTMVCSMAIPKSNIKEGSWAASGAELKF